MRSLLLALAVLVLTSPALAQITVTNSSFFKAGDSLKTIVDDNPAGISVGAIGGNQVWDFSSLEVDGQQRAAVKVASAGNAASNFPTATIVVQSGPQEAYYQVTGTAMLLQGAAGEGLGPVPINLVPKFNPPLVERRAPMNYGDFNITESSFLVSFSTALLPDSLLAVFPIKPDSIRINQTTSRADLGDAWGSLTIPGGTYEVLRERRRSQVETTVEVKVFGAWLDLAAFGFPLPGLGKDTIEEYYFFAKDIKEPIAVVEVEPTDINQVLSVQFKDNGVLSIHQPLPFSAPLMTGPNPASDVIRFDLQPLDRPATLEIYTVWGQLVGRRDGLQGVCTTAVDQLGQGVYFYRILSADRLQESGMFQIQR